MTIMEDHLYQAILTTVRACAEIWGDRSDAATDLILAIDASRSPYREEVRSWRDEARCGEEQAAWSRLAFTSLLPMANGRFSLADAELIMDALMDLVRIIRQNRGDEIPFWFYDQRPSKAPPVDKDKVDRVAEMILAATPAPKPSPGQCPVPPPTEPPATAE